MIDKSILARNFSRCADRYDAYADVQRTAADALMRYLPAGGINKILEIGCGTGILTARLKERYPASRVEAVDISCRMIEKAKGKLPGTDIIFSVCDAEEMRLERRFDLVASSAVFQWFQDIAGSIAAYRGALTEKGTLAFSVFGPATFLELDSVLKSCVDHGPSVESSAFCGKGELEKILKKHFSGVLVDELVVAKTFASLEELLKNIKYTGARGAAAGRDFAWSRGLINKTERCYKTAYRDIRATYQILLCRAGI